MTQKGEGHGAKIFGAHYLDDGWRYGVGANRAPIGNDYCELNGHVNGDPNILRAKYLENGWR